MDKIIYEIRRPAFVRWFVLAALAVMLIMTLSLLFSGGGGALMTLLTLAFAGVLSFFGWSLLQTRAQAIRFDGETLSDNAGTVIAHLDEIEKIERGLAVFKPSGGFALVLKTAQPMGWSPGLWWRWGRRVGVGGAISNKAGKAMADAMTMAMSERASKLD